MHYERIREIEIYLSTEETLGLAQLMIQQQQASLQQMVFQQLQQLSQYSGNRLPALSEYAEEY